MQEHRNSKLTRGAFWASAGFYGLIAFEFFYMFSPFAAYLYGVYGPGLKLLEFSESTSWLIAFFMPHIARETTSYFITWHEWIGMILFIGGLFAFFIGAVQIYWSKLKKRGAVVKGIYRHIRHPQYLALMISGFGMVLLWPRYLVLFGFVTLCFAYFLLARLEEKICLRDFPEYDSYTRNTGMFLPGSFEKWFHLIPLLSGKLAKFLSGFLLYIVFLVAGFWAAELVHSHSIRSLYTWSTSSEVYLSVGELNRPEFQELIRIAQSNRDIAEKLSGFDTSNTRFINYVMPIDLYISEVPMYIPEGRTPSHRPPHLANQSRYKIIFTMADFGPADAADGLDILRKAINKKPIFEVWIDRNSGQVEQIHDPPLVEIYDGMPVPVF